MNSTSDLAALEFSRVLDALAERALGDLTRPEVRRLLPLSSLDEIDRRADAVADIRHFLDESSSSSSSPLGLGAFADISPAVEQSRPTGAVLDPADLLPLVPFLTIAGRVGENAGQRPDLTHLAALAAPLVGCPDLLAALDRTLDTSDIGGGVLDTASFELGDIRQRRRALERRITRRLEEFVADETTSRFLQDSFITQRSGRWVIPVRMDARGSIEGVVHDVSRSGETAFVEPLAILSLSNDLENLSAEEKAEVIRILRHITSLVRAHAASLLVQLAALVAFDLHHAIALFARALGLERPGIATDGSLALFGARHPILLMNALARDPSSARASVVPLDVSLSGSDLALVITGPNAGGKTVVIKTVGLAVIMALTGIPIPAASSSTVPLVDAVLADIGDEQSIDARLSTFAAHISNLARILRAATPSSLVLIDELGTGTDPVQGAALGSAILETLAARGARSLATTHLVDIVVFVHRREDMRNASMEFDRASLAPLYRLSIGEPGQSHAIEVAERYGLPTDVIALARSLAGRREIEFQSLVEDLAEKRRTHEAALVKLGAEQREVASLRASLDARLAEADEIKRRARTEALEEMRDMLDVMKREAGRALEEAKREKKKQAARELALMQERVQSELDALSPRPSIPIGEIAPGLTVRVRSLRRTAVVTQIDRQAGRVRVSVGGKDLDLPAGDLEPAGESQGKPSPARAAEPEVPEVAELKLIGMRVEEALMELEPFLNHAALARLREVRIIHGIGTGALRNAVRTNLRAHPLVASIRPGEQFEGGEGVTLATMK
jgi:DNA mismatch repair protein MutS2